MNTMVTAFFCNKENSLDLSDKKTKNEIWQEVINVLTDPTSEMDVAEQKNYEQKVVQKMKTGKRLSSEELEYLRVHNPELYRSAMRVENNRKALKARLNSCRSKEEVNQVVSMQVEFLQAMKNDPDKEYMAAMIKKEVEDFKKSSAYARLPLECKTGKKKEDTGKNTLPECDEKEEIYAKLAIYTKMWFNCSRFGEMLQDNGV